MRMSSNMSRVPWTCFFLLFLGALVTSTGCGGSPGAAPSRGLVLTPDPTVTSVDPAFGADKGGTPITITGTNFTSRTTVSIGGTPAGNVNVVTGNEVTCITPGGPLGPVDVSVANTPGSATLPAGFTYIIPPTAIRSIVPNVGATSGGMHHTINGVSFADNAPGPNTVLIGGVPALNVVTNSDSSISFDSPPATAGGTTVRVTNVHGSPTSPFTYFDPIYAGDGGNSASTATSISNFYAIDVATGDAYTIGPIGFAVTGMFWDGTTLYGTTARSFSNTNRQLITINPMTGAGTLMAATGGIQFPGVAFDTITGLAYGGTVFDWSSLATTGNVSFINSLPAIESGGGVAADLGSTTWYYMTGNNSPLYTVVPTTGVFTAGPPLSGGTLGPYVPIFEGGRMNSATFHQGALYAVEGTASRSGNNQRQLHRVNTVTGVLTRVGAPLPNLIDAIVSPTR